MEVDPAYIETTRHKKSFPWVLVFLLVVACCAGLPLIATLVVPNMIGKIGFAQRATANAEMAMLESALAEYALRNGGQYPDSLEALVEPDSNGVTFLGMGSLPPDPWKRPYLYQVTEDGMSFVLETLGKDGEAGGVDENEDLRVVPSKTEAE